MSIADMDKFQEKEMIKKRTFAKKARYSKQTLKQILKQTQPWIIVKEHVSTICMGVEKNQKI